MVVDLWVLVFPVLPIFNVGRRIHRRGALKGFATVLWKVMLQTVVRQELEDVSPEPFRWCRKRIVSKFLFTFSKDIGKFISNNLQLTLINEFIE